MTTGVKEHVHFLYADGAHGGNAFALRVVTDGAPAAQPATMKYNHFDHLGSVMATSDESGQVVGPGWNKADATVFGYDAWGARRNPDGSSASPASFNLQVGGREFTSHETIPNVGLVNMNGRVYDPELGRFLTPDPNVQFVANLQSYNRYSYVTNNPLRYTDPTGYGFWSTITSGSFWLGVGELALGALSCAGGPELCVSVGVLIAVGNSTAALAQGASVAQVAIGAAAGFLAGQFGSAVGGLVGNYAGSVIGGTVAGAVSGAITTAAMGGKLGWNVLIGAASGAVSAGIAWSLQGTNPVSQESAAESQGEGRQFRIKGDVAGIVDPPPDPEPGKIGDSEPIADPRVRKVLRDAYADSNPGDGDFYDPQRKEHGGYIFSSDHSVPSSVSLENFRRIVALAKELGTY